MKLLQIFILIILISSACDTPDEPDRQQATHGTGNNGGTTGNPSATTPTYTLSVNGKTNCVLLNSSVAASKSIGPGSFQINVTGNAYFSPGASHKNVFIRYSGSDDDHVAKLAIGGSKTLGLRTGKMYAFFADWNTITDNSGDALISFGTNSLIVNGKTNCILLDNSVAARAIIPEGVYKVKVTGNAYFSPGATHYDVLVRYAGSMDDELDILSIGGEKTLSIRMDMVSTHFLQIGTI